MIVILPQFLLRIMVVSCAVFLFGEGDIWSWGMDIVAFDLMLL